MPGTITEGPTRSYVAGGDNFSKFSQAYNSFSGSDISAVFAGVKFSELQGLAYSIEREKAGIWTLGQVAPRSYSRGKRIIAGNFVAVNFDRNALLDIFDNSGGLFMADKDDIRPDFKNPDDLTTFSTMNTSLDNSSDQYIDNEAAYEKGYGGQLVREADSLLRSYTGTDDIYSAAQAESRAFEAETAITSPYEDQEIAKVWHADQVLPFNIAVAAANEYGAAATMKIYGVEVLNETSGFSVDDMVIESSWTFVAREIGPWQPSAHSKQIAALLYEKNNGLSSM